MTFLPGAVFVLPKETQATESFPPHWTVPRISILSVRSIVAVIKLQAPRGQGRQPNVFILPKLVPDARQLFLNDLNE